MMVKIIIRATPVGLAHPLISPKTPGLLVKIHSPQLQLASGHDTKDITITKLTYQTSIKKDS